MRKNLERTLSDFMGETILRQLSLHQVRTAETYATTLRSFMRFRQGRDCLLTDLTSELVQRYEAWLYASGVVPNTASFYLKRLRAVYNKDESTVAYSIYKTLASVDSSPDVVTKRSGAVELAWKDAEGELSGNFMGKRLYAERSLRLRFGALRDRRRRDRLGRRPALRGRGDLDPLLERFVFA